MYMVPPQETGWMLRKPDAIDRMQKGTKSKAHIGLQPEYNSGDTVISQAPDASCSIDRRQSARQIFAN